MSADDVSAETIRLGDFGCRLVIGCEQPNGGPRSTALSFKDWTGADERAIAEYRKKKNPTFAKYVTYVLAYFTEKWGHHDFAHKPINDRMHIISTSWLVDVFAAWIHLRNHALGSTYSADYVCERCGHQATYNFDLEDLDVTAPESLESAIIKEVELRRGMVIAGELRRVLKTRPAQWFVYERMFAQVAGGTSNAQERKLAIVEGSVCGHGDSDETCPITSTHTDTLTKYDFETLADACTDDTIGVQMAFSVECQGCKAEINSAVNWVYDTFFTI